MLRKRKGCLYSWRILGDTKLRKLSSEKEKRLALKIQLTFQQKVIGVKCARTYFTMSSGGVMKPISKLLENLKHVITWNSDTSDTDVDFSKPYIISTTELNSIFNKYGNSQYVTTNHQENHENSQHLGFVLIQVPLFCVATNNGVIDMFCFATKGQHISC